MGLPYLSPHEIVLELLEDIVEALPRTNSARNNMSIGELLRLLGKFDVCCDILISFSDIKGRRSKLRKKLNALETYVLLNIHTKDHKAVSGRINYLFYLYS